jgi:hypothetical protein
VGAGRRQRQADQSEEGRLLPRMAGDAGAAGLPPRVAHPELRRLWRRHHAAAVLPAGAQRRQADRMAQPTHAKDGSPDLFGRREKWRGARECIDWSLRGRSIFGRKIPLAPRTVQRIYAGAVRFGWPSPYLVVLRQHMAARSIDLPVPTISARRHACRAGDADPGPLRRPRRAIARAKRRPADADHHGQGRHRAGRAVPDRPARRAARTVDRPAAAHRDAIDRQAIAEPFVVDAAHGDMARERSPSQRRVKSLDDPLGAIHAQGGRFAMASPFVLSQASGGAPRVGRRAAADHRLGEQRHGADLALLRQRQRRDLQERRAAARLGDHARTASA